MTEERKHAILFAATILLARKLQPMLEVDTETGQIEHYQWRAIHQASRILAWTRLTSDGRQPSKKKGGEGIPRREEMIQNSADQTITLLQLWVNMLSGCGTAGDRPPIESI